MKIIGKIILPVLMALLVVSCSDEDAQFISAGDANVRIALAYATKNALCESTTSITVPAFADVRESDLEACVINILALDCTNWASGGELPVACLALQVRL